jgi:PhnB protein
MAFFAQELFIANGIKDVSFYTKAFGAIELRRFSNDDDSIHVSEFSIGEALFHLHEVTAKKYFQDPGKTGGTSVCVGLFVKNVDEVMKKAIEAGASEINPATSYDYGYRQGLIKDPFGHYWQIQQKI